MSRIQTRRADYVHFARFETRWKDNDLYGHLNNVENYRAFDTVINRHLIDAGGLDLHGGEIIGLCVESQCRFHDSFSFPEVIEAGLRVGHLGRTSARYELGLFKTGSDVPAAEGHFVHVFVDRAGRRPCPPHEALRAVLEALLPPA